MRYLCELHTCIHCHSSGHSVCAHVYILKSTAYIHASVYQLESACVLEEMSLWCLHFQVPLEKPKTLTNSPKRVLTFSILHDSLYYLHVLVTSIIFLNFIYNY